ncbi:UNVERIFIED_CONTAM: histone lysine methyltransferase SET2 [Hammondia hammondi]|eukprot:XP_008883210.1 histone lysine methyltransferase SET2 [Hammondia hammondi]
MPKKLRRAPPLAGRPRPFSPSLYPPSKGVYLTTHINACGVKGSQNSQEKSDKARRHRQAASPYLLPTSSPCSSATTLPGSSCFLSSVSRSLFDSSPSPLVANSLSPAYSAPAPSSSSSSSPFSSFSPSASPSPSASSSSSSSGINGVADVSLAKRKVSARDEKARREERDAEKGAQPDSTLSAGSLTSSSPIRGVTGRGREAVNRASGAEGDLRVQISDVEVHISSSDDDGERERVLALVHSQERGRKGIAFPKRRSGWQGGAKTGPEAKLGDWRGPNWGRRTETEDSLRGSSRAEKERPGPPAAAARNGEPPNDPTVAWAVRRTSHHAATTRKAASEQASLGESRGGGARARIEAKDGHSRRLASEVAGTDPVHTPRERMGRVVEHVGEARNAWEIQEEPGGPRKRQREEERQGAEGHGIRNGAQASTIRSPAGGPKRLRETAAHEDERANASGEKKQEGTSTIRAEGEETCPQLGEGQRERQAPSSTEMSLAIQEAFLSSPNCPDEGACGRGELLKPMSASEGSDGASLSPSPLCSRNAVLAEDRETPFSHSCSPSEEEAERRGQRRNEEAALLRFQKKMESLVEAELGTARALAADAQGAVRVYNAALWLEHWTRDKEASRAGGRGEGSGKTVARGQARVRENDREPGDAWVKGDASEEAEHIDQKATETDNGPPECGGRYSGRKGGQARGGQNENTRGEANMEEATEAAEAANARKGKEGKPEGNEPAGPRREEDTENRRREGETRSSEMDRGIEGTTRQERGGKETGEQPEGDTGETRALLSSASAAQDEQQGAGPERGAEVSGERDENTGSMYYDSECDSMYGEGADLDPVDENVQNALLGDRENDVISVVEAWRNIQQLCRSVGSGEDGGHRSSSPSCFSPAASLSKEERNVVRSQAYRQLPPRVWNDNLELHCAVCERVNGDPHTTTMLVCEAYCQRAFHPACVGLGNLELDWADEDDLRSRAFSFQCEDCCDEVLRCSACGLRKPRRQLARCSHMLCRRFYCWPACVESTVHISPFQRGPRVPTLRGDDLRRLAQAISGPSGSAAATELTGRGTGKDKCLLAASGSSSSCGAGCGWGSLGRAGNGERADHSALNMAAAGKAPQSGECRESEERTGEQRACAEADIDGAQGQEGLNSQAEGSGAAQQRETGKGLRHRQKEQKKGRGGARGGSVPSLLFASRETREAQRKDSTDGQSDEANRLVEAARILYEAGEDVFFDAQGRERFICSRHFCVSCHTLEAQHFTWETHVRQLAQLADDLQLALPSLTADAPPETTPHTGKSRGGVGDASTAQLGSRQPASSYETLELVIGRSRATGGHPKKREGHVDSVDAHSGATGDPGKTGGDETGPQPGASQSVSLPGKTPGASSSILALQPASPSHGDADSLAGQLPALRKQLAFARVCFEFVKESTRGWTDRRIFAKQYKMHRPDPFPSLLVSPLVDIWECQLCRSAFCSRCVPPSSKILSDASGAILCDFCRFSESWKRRRSSVLRPVGAGEARLACRGAGDEMAGERGGRDSRRRKGKKGRREDEQRRIAEMVKDVVAGADCITSLTTNFRRFLRTESSPSQNTGVTATRVIDDHSWESCALLEDDPNSGDESEAGKALSTASSLSARKGEKGFSSQSDAPRPSGASRFAPGPKVGDHARKRRKTGEGEALEPRGAGPAPGGSAESFGADRLNFQFTTSCIFPAQCRNLLRARSEGEMCVCTGSSCDADCLNRSRGIQCDRKRCKFGTADCGNRQFKRGGGSGSQTFCFVQDCGEKGLGVFARERIEEGKLVIEYVGEVLDAQLLAARVRAYTQQELARGQPQHWYVMEVIPHVYIDSTRVGNIARLVNHSCEPNCSLQRVNVHGTYRMGIFALRPILPGEEISYDYGFTRKGFGQGFVCFCGSSKCRGRIGGDSRRNKFGDVADNALKRKEGFDSLLCKQLCQAITSQSFSRAERIPPPSPYTWRRDAIGTSAQARAWLEKKLNEGEADNPFFAQFIFDFHLYDAAVNFVKLLLLDGKTVEEFARSKTKSMCMDIPWSLLASDFNDKGITQAIRHSILTEERLNKAKKFFLSNMAIRAAEASGRSAQTALQDLVDLNWGATEVCSLCDSEGVVSVCDSCAEAYHADCAELSQDDEGHSLCPACLLSDSRRQWHLMSEADRVLVGVRLNSLRLLEVLAKSPHQSQLFARQTDPSLGGEDYASACAKARLPEKTQDETEACAGSVVAKRTGRTDASRKGGKGSFCSDHLGHEKGRGGGLDSGAETFPVLAGLHVDVIQSVFTLQEEDEALFFEAGYVEE